MRSQRLISKFAAIALTLGFCLFAWFLLIMPVSSWKDAKISEQARTHSEFLHLNDSITRLQKQLSQVSQGENADVFWKASQQGAASAYVQSAVSELAALNKIGIRSITPVNGSAMPYENLIGFRVEAEAALDHLSDFLFALEFNKPVLLVEGATLRRINRPGQVSEQPVIFAQIDLFAVISLEQEAGE